MATRKRSERSRWVQIFALCEPNKANTDGFAQHEHQKAQAVVRAFARVGRVVRVDVENNLLIFRARKG